MTPQQKMKDLLTQAGIPAKEIKCYGSQVMIVCRGQASARKFASLLANFCATVRGPVQSIDRNKVNMNTVLKPSSHYVWLVWGTI